MVYVTSDGRVVQSRPWGLGMIADAIMGTINFVTFFFRSMFHLDDPSTRGQYGQRRSSSRGPAAPRRGIGGIGRISGIAAPPCAPGGG